MCVRLFGADKSSLSFIYTTYIDPIYIRTCVYRMCTHIRSFQKTDLVVVLENKERGSRDNNTLWKKGRIYHKKCAF